MSLFQALVLALLQGVTELFPVSSLGHTVILPKLLGWNINQADPTFLAFVVPLREHDGGRPAGQPHARGRCALRVSTGDAHHSWRRPAKGPGPLHPGRVAPSPGLPGWRRDGWRGRLPECRLPHAILSGGTA